MHGCQNNVGADLRGRAVEKRVGLESEVEAAKCAVGVNLSSKEVLGYRSEACCTKVTHKTLYTEKMLCGA